MKRASGSMIGGASLGGAVIIVMLSAAPLMAQSLVLPLGLEPERRPVAATTITVDLSDAAVEVIFDPAVEESYLEAGLYEGRSGVARLAVREQGEGIAVERDGGGATPFWMVIVTPGSRSLEVRGARLNLTIGAFPSESAVAESAESGGVALGRGAARLLIEVEESTLRLGGRHQGHVTLSASHLEMVEAGGGLEFDLSRSNAEIERFTGRLDLQGTGAELGVVELEGTLIFDLRNSELFIQDGGGAVNGTSNGSLVILDAWRGNASLGGRQTSYEVRSVSDGKARLEVEGKDLTVGISAFEGDINADLEGGSLTGSGLAGTTVIRAKKQAGIDLQDLQRVLELHLGEQSTARVSRMGGRMKASLDGAFMTADLIRILEISSRGSQIDVNRVERMGTVSASDTRLDLDLSTIENHPALLLRGETVAQVRLPTPCSVRLAGKTPQLERRLRVSGCDLQVPGQQGSAKFNEDVVTLKTSLEGECFLEVTGAGSR